MGNTQSQCYHKISRALPQVHEFGWNNDSRVDKDFKAFINPQDRDQFIYSVMTLISNNGMSRLQDHEFKLLWSRRPDDKMVVTLVAMKEGVIEAKIEPRSNGRDQADAFRAFKKHVELRLNELLETVPDASMSVATPLTSAARSPTLSAVSDLPPAYEPGKTSPGGCGKRG